MSPHQFNCISVSVICLLGSSITVSVYANKVNEHFKAGDVVMIKRIDNYLLACPEKLPTAAFACNSSFLVLVAKIPDCATALCEIILRLS